MYTERLVRNVFGYSDDLHRLYMQENARQTSCLLLSNFLEVRQVCRNALVAVSCAFDLGLGTSASIGKSLIHRSIRVCTLPFTGMNCVYKTAQSLNRRISALTTPALTCVTTTLNTVNPVAIAIRKGPRVISTPLKFLCEEAQALKQVLTHPLNSLIHTLQFIAKKPKRTVKLLQVLGVPIDPYTVMIINCESHLDDLNTKVINALKNGIDPVKQCTSNMEKVRGRFVIAMLKALFEDWTEMENVARKYLTELAITSSQRVGAKCVLAATDSGNKQLINHLNRI